MALSFVKRYGGSRSRSRWLVLFLAGVMACCGSADAAPTAAQIRAATAAYRKTVPRECEVCAKPARIFRELEVHHIHPQASFPAKAADLDNMILVCRPCHMWVCHPGDFGKYTDDLRRWLKDRNIRRNLQ